MPEWLIKPLPVISRTDMNDGWTRTTTNDLHDNLPMIRWERIFFIFPWFKPPLPVFMPLKTKLVWSRLGGVGWLAGLLWGKKFVVKIVSIDSDCTLTQDTDSGLPTIIQILENVLLKKVAEN